MNFWCVLIYLCLTLISLAFIVFIGQVFHLFKLISNYIIIFEDIINGIV